MQPSSKSDSHLRHRSRPGEAPLATQNGSVNPGLANGIANPESRIGALSDFVLILSLVFGGCCVIFASLSRPSSRAVNNADGQKEYFLGIFMLTLSLLLTGVLGVLQEQTYNKYGPCWREGVFYTHLLSLPLFAFLTKGIREGIEVLGSAKEHISNAYLVFAVNLMTQLLCVSGVNQLASRVSSVSTNLVLTSRKALSLWLSVWLFGSEWNYGLVIGAVLVFLGSVLYACVTTRR
ncbi:YEA4_1 [Sanghuangporus vaninii]